MGRVTDANGIGIRAINVSLSGPTALSAQTDNYGYYLFGDLTAGGNYVVTPSSAIYTFAPQSLNFTNTGGSQAANFRATAVTYQIDVSVVDEAGRGIAGIFVSPMSPPTDANGRVILMEAAGANYTLTPYSPNYTFSPANISFPNLNGNAAARFVATPLPKTVQFPLPIYPVFAYNGHVDVYVGPGLSCCSRNRLLSQR